MWTELGLDGPTWPAVGAVLLLGRVLRLLVELARRRTLVDVTTRAPAGTQVVQGGGSGGPAMWISVGSGTSAVSGSEESG
ncbi:hypothetical protein GCM10011578_089170 [Streptomyces fuscichromogenes]|uniref:Uncharacterized protein n=1 Tax=Streptomyces fuscichromogenes TaxID=1324013 RepID=A0A917XN06_9ACTN|nr:hypothetical protein GCM10011578_089170 [Streptomyces fuscichromogenes]